MGATAAHRPDVVLVTVDTLRPDALGWVAGRNQTPVLDRLAATGAAFPAAVSPAPVTLPSHASMLTGLEPLRHGAVDNGRPLPAEIPVLAERLRRAGWRTAAFVSGAPLTRPFGLDRGFDVYDDRLPHRGIERRAADTAAAAVEWLGRQTQSPVFMWVHFFDPHDPYEAAGPPSASAREAYEAEVRAVDTALAPLLGLPRLADALVVMAADHGEGLGEHGEMTHGLFVYESTIAVPLVLRWPERIKPGRSSAPVRLVDITPTVLDLLALPALAKADGVSLRPWLDGFGGEPPAAVSISQRGFASYGWAPLAAVRKGRWKLIRGSRTTLHDVESSLGEGRDVAGSERRRAGELATILRERRTQAYTAAAPAPTDGEALAALAALGYLGTGGTGLAPIDGAGLADPRDRIEVWNQLSAGLSAAAGGEMQRALSLYDQVLATEPNNPFALSRSGWALAELGRLDAAIQRLHQAVRLRPTDHETHRVLATVLERAGRFGDAADAWETVVGRAPKDVDAWVQLARLALMADRRRESLTAMEQAVALAPERSDLRSLLEAVRGEARRDGP